jgi:hypothetical protein
MREKIGLFMVCVIGLAVYLSIARAQSVPQLINYQGRLTNAAGQPLTDGSTVDLTFAFYGAATGDTAYLTVLQEDVLVTGGIYNVLIGSGTITPGTESTLADVFQKHTEVWMGVKVDMETEMAPRSRITSVPYAMSVDPTLIGDMIGKADWDGDGFNKTGGLIDCNDGNASIHPGAPELCDGLDNQCSGDAGYGYIDEGCVCTDADNDNYFAEDFCGTGVDCNDGDSAINPGEIDDSIDGIDQNCDGYDGPPLYMFSNDSGFWGNIVGGRAGADSICQTDIAYYPDLPTANVKAFISINDTDEIRDMPANYGVPTTRWIVGPTGKKIADDWADLLDGTIDQTLMDAEIVSWYWWSGSWEDGSLDPDNCSGFTIMGTDGMAGHYNQTGNLWIWDGIATSCNLYEYYILCLAWE